MKIAIISLCIVLGTVVTKGQSLKDDLDRMYQQYTGKENLYVEIESSVYENGEERHKTATKLYKKGGLYHYKMENQAILINDDYLVVVDHRMKNMSYDIWTARQAKQLANMPVPLAKDILAKYPIVEYRGEKNGLRHYSLQNEKIQMSRVEVFFNVKTGFIQKMMQYYNPNLVKGDIYMKMLFDKISTNPSFATDTFSEKQYLTIEGNKATAAKPYKKYVLRASTNLR